MEHLESARLTRDTIVSLGGAFMTSPQLAAEESKLGQQKHSLYFRGRSAVLGDPPAVVITAVFGLFPESLVTLMLERSDLPADEAIQAYSRSCAAWGSAKLESVEAPGEAADLLLRIVDHADLTALPLAAGWRMQQRPDDDVERLAHALMLAREIRGGFHFAALRTCGLGVAEATVAHPHGGRERLLRTGWRPDDADEVIRKAESRSDLRHRWQEAEDLTDEMFAETMKVLDQTETIRLTDLLVGYRAQLQS
ncbi:SCO6745 family protein [Arthrobacter monumenti]